MLITTPAFTQHQQDPGYLKINYDSSGIEIRLDNKPVGLTPLPIITLPAGTYQVSARHPNAYIWGNFDWQDSIKISSRDTSIIQPDFNRTVYVKTNPFDAQVFLDNELAGETPLPLSINSHNSFLLLKKAGYKDSLIAIRQVTGGYLNVTLTENGDTLGLENIKIIKMRKSEKRYKQGAYSLWGLSILAGLTTVYLKDQADRKYEQYLTAGSHREMNKYYRDAKKYDRYSYISMGILQGCFVLSFYFLKKSFH